MILDGKALSDLMAEQLRGWAAGRSIRLAILLVGNDPGSVKYVAMKQKRAADIGILCDVHHLSETAAESEILKLIDGLNHDDAVDGIMVQLPLPGHADADTITRRVAPAKDVDGLNPAGHFIPATVRGIEKLMEHYLFDDRHDFDLSGKTAVVVGASEIVGRPAAKMLLDHHATIIVCHSHTQNLAEFTRMADILVSATGVVGLITPAHIKPGVVIVDAGDIGDVEHACYELAAAYTPVPGGVGPMTVISLLENTIAARGRANTI